MFLRKEKIVQSWKTTAFLESQCSYYPTKNPKNRMETWYDKNVLPSKMIFQLYDPSLVLLKDFFFLSFHLSPLPFNKLNVISDWAYSFLFGCCWISLQRNCTCWSFDQITPALFFRMHFAPLVNSNRARNEREWKIYRPHHIDLVSI